MDPAERSELIERFLAADRRGRHALLKQLTPHLERDDVARIAPALRDPSPRTAARITALLARHQLDELFESLLANLKPGKISILRSQYEKLRQ